LPLERLQKIISRAGITSRRHAELLISSGQVRVNGQVVKELGSKADPAKDRIVVAGRVVEIQEQRHYFLMNKPPKYVSTMADPEGRPSLQELLRGLPTRVFPVGRLEYAAGGLLLLTDDGELTNRILKLAPRLPQTFWIKVKGRLGDDEQARLAGALHGKVNPVSAAKGGKTGPNPWYEVKFSSVRGDMMRRMLFETGHPVEKLRRVGLATLELEDLPEGAYRALQPVELRKLELNLKRLEETPAPPVVHAGGRKPLRPRTANKKYAFQTHSERGKKPFAGAKRQDTSVNRREHDSTGHERPVRR
jgi:23S rRNA pseudouridine2605 synthase